MRRLLSVLAFLVALTGCTSPPNQPNLPVHEDSAGSKLYYAKCAKCHKLYDPAGYSDEEWSMWMKKMKKKAKLTDEQNAILMLYIDTNFRPREKRPGSS